jgi:hypothetical protein
MDNTNASAGEQSALRPLRGKIWIFESDREGSPGQQQRQIHRQAEYFVDGSVKWSNTRREGAYGGASFVEKVRVNSKSFWVGKSLALPHDSTVVAQRSPAWDMFSLRAEIIGIRMAVDRAFVDAPMVDRVVILSDCSAAAERVSEAYNREYEGELEALLESIAQRIENLWEEHQVGVIIRLVRAHQEVTDYESEGMLLASRVEYEPN